MLVAEYVRESFFPPASAVAVLIEIALSPLSPLLQSGYVYTDIKPSAGGALCVFQRVTVSQMVV